MRFSSIGRLVGSRLAGPSQNRCSIYRNKEVGVKFAAMLKLGRSKPWPEALAAFSGEHVIDASAIMDYFAPLSAWLDKQNRSRACKR
jgi:peptidyl-dipeptidase A